MTRTAKVLPQFLFFLLCLCTWSVTCVGQTNIPAGSVSGVWTKAGSPYIVNGDIAIDINQKLTIEAGSEVRFSGNYSLSVQGCLEAVGSASDSIRFTVTDNSGFSTNTHTGWHGIRFQNVTHPDSSAIVYCVLEYGKAGGGSESNNGGAIFSKGFGRIKIRNSTLRNNRSAYGGAIAVSGVSNLNLKDLLIRGNYASEDGGGIYSLTSNVTLARSHIVNNNASQGGGIYIRTSSIMNINKTVIVGNQGGALEAFWQCQVNLDNTTAAGNTGLPDGFDIYLSDLNGKNSILWNKSNNNTYSEINDLDQSNVNLDYCIVKGVIDPEWIVSNSSTKDPKFINLPIFDAHLGWTGYPSKDATMSSAIDAGDPTNPHDPDGTIADIGALPFMQTSDAFPTVRFTADPIQGVIPLEVAFSNYSTQAAGEITSWKWSFGDNSISSEKEPVHHYTSPGTYDVKLVAQNEKGKKDSLTLTNYIKILTGTIVDNPTVSGVWTKQGSPYNIYNSVTIPAGNTLTIEPGVEVVFFGPYTLNVNGNLLARGTAADSITFDRFDDKSSWHSIRIENVASDSDSTIFEYCRIAHTEYQGGNVTTNGGNAVLVKNFNKVRISNCLLRNNRGGRGAGVYVEKGDIKINNNVIRNNLVDQYGAGIYVDTGSPLIAGNRIEKNYGGSYAGGLWLSASKSRIENNIISYNNCYWYGAGLVITNGSDCTLLRNLVSYNESEHDDGGGISISGSSPSIVHNTIAFNKGEDGEGVLIKGTSYPNFVNTIIYGNRDRYQDANSTDEVYIESSNARPNFYNCAIQSGMGGIRGPFNGVAKDIISTSPLFANAAGNDFTLSWDNYPLADDSKSSCIDTGALDSPHDSDGSIADIGMQHFHQTLGKFSPRAEFTADTLLGYNELSVSFQDLSQKGSANITGWHWDFGDGSSSTEQNPIHEYTTEGRFDVTLTIKDVNGFERNIKKENYIRLIDGVYVKGNVSGIFDAPRYVVGGDIIVESANILEVKPGVEFMFMGSYELKVLGSLKAKGTAAKPIVFTSSDTTGLDLAHATTGYSEKLAGWKGIYVYASGSQDSTIIDHCKVQFVENNGRGAIYAFSNNGAAGMRISNSEVSYNSTQGIYVFATKLIIRNNYIHHNYARAYQKGAGIYFNAGSPKVINNIISNNQTADDGGGMCIDWDSRPSLIGNVVTHNKATRAGGICDYAGWIELINNTISFNVSTGSSGGGYYVLYAGDVKFTNTVITNNYPLQVEIPDYYTRVGFRNCILEGGSGAIAGVQSNIFLYENVATSDPKLMDGKYAHGRPLSGTPVVDAGTTTGILAQLPQSDVIGNVRIAGSQIDIGAYEYTTEPPLTVANPIADVNQEEDFDPFSVSLESVFAYQYGSRFLSYSLENVNSFQVLNVSLRGSSLYFTSIPDKYGDQTVTVVASNGISQVSSTFVVHVAPIDDAPQFSVMGDLFLEEDFSGAIRYNINLTIPPGEENQVRFFTLEPNTVDFVNLQFDGAGVLEFTSKPNLFGSQCFKLTLTEGTQTKSEIFMFGVQPVDDPPNIEVDNSPFEVRVGEERILTISVSDAEGDDVTLTSTPINNSISFDSSVIGVNSYSITIKGQAVGQSGVKFSASDGKSFKELIVPIKVTLVSGVADEAAGCEVYPNPAADYINVKAEAGSSIAVYDTKGQPVLLAKVGSTDVTMDVRHLTPGLYLLRINGNKMNRIVKIIIE